MKVSLNWLKEYVNIPDNMSVHDLCHELTMSGSKVENIEYFGQKVENVVVGRVTKKEACAQDEKASVLTVDVLKRQLTIVAKISDVMENDLVPVALVGAKIHDKVISQVKIAGIESQGMICHVSDLSIDTSIFNLTWLKPSGLIAFPSDTPIGANVNEVLGLGDAIIEFEITPNRPDCLSMEGIAREVSATLNVPLIKSYANNEILLDKVNEMEGITVEIATENCSRYMCSVVKNVAIHASPYQMQIKLIKLDVRPISNIVDITNYVMLEIGQPMHAFDLSKIEDNKIIARQANASEKLLTLDGIEHTLTPDVIVIANGKNAMAMAGIMGGENSAICDTTQNIVIESANFSRGNIRISSRRQATRTESSARFEKGLPQKLAEHGMQRMLELLANDGMKVENRVIDVQPKKQELTEIVVDYSYLNRLLGSNLSKQEVDEYLARLDLKVIDGKITVPYYRVDIEKQVDLAEELARIYGLNNISSTLPDVASRAKGYTKKQQYEMKLLEMCATKGYMEAYNYSFVSRAMYDRACVKENSPIYDMLKITNPLNKEFEYMRTSMLPGMLECLERNYMRHNEVAKLYEKGRIYLKGQVTGEEWEQQPVTEIKEICIGQYLSGDIYSLKQDILEILKQLGIDVELVKYMPTNQEFYHPGISTKLVIQGHEVATLGKLSPLVKQNYNLPDETYIATLEIDEIIKIAMDSKVVFNELTKYQAVVRDISITVNKMVTDASIKETIKKVSNLIEQVTLFDVYTGNQVEKEQKSLSYSIRIMSKVGTLKDEEITDVMNKIIKKLEEEKGAKIRQ